MSLASTRSIKSLSQVHKPHYVPPYWRNQNSNSLEQQKVKLLSTTSCCLFQTTPSLRQSSQTSNEQLLSQMHIRLVTENGFLSWCRNAYMSTVVGVAMMAEGTSALAQSAGLGALMVGTMNLGWGTGCHVTNLVRLRHVSGMSSITLFLHLAGSCLHFFLWAFVLICFVGFLDESRWPADSEGPSETDNDPVKQKQGRGDSSRRV